MRTLSTQTTQFVAKFMVGILLFATIAATPGVAYAAERVLSNWGNITITRDVSEDVYLSEVFSLGGNNFVGFVQDPVSWQTYFATSNDAVNWELQSEFFNLVYGGGRFVGVNQNGLHFTDNGTNWSAPIGTIGAQYHVSPDMELTVPVRAKYLKINNNTL